MDHDFPVGKWMFGYREGDLHLTMISDTNFCREVIENFSHFLRGAGFCDSNVIDGFVAVLEEMESIRPPAIVHEES